MSFDRLLRRVGQAETAVDARRRRTDAALRELQDAWKAMWTPGRIVIAGLASGFVIGRSEPLQVIARSGGLLRTANSLTTLFSGLAVTAATRQADAAADQAAQTDMHNPDTGIDTEAAATQARYRASERLAHDYLEQVAAAARQTGGAREP